ncbi:hypothetical protein [Actinomadura spongiicola]|uniref:hypothetical protein n=1 Tax=Actinomadura spongiicola TaxID=2303421 RepID=UPI0013142AC6|nr:hypothetical protein [Actinomadura spongiicola]
MAFGPVQLVVLGFDHPRFVHPGEGEVTGELDGPDAIHRQLVRWLDRAGLRR